LQQEQLKQNKNVNQPNNQQGETKHNLATAVLSSLSLVSTRVSSSHWRQEDQELQTEEEEAEDLRQEEEAAAEDLLQDQEEAEAEEEEERTLQTNKNKKLHKTFENKTTFCRWRRLWNFNRSLYRRRRRTRTLCVFQLMRQIVDLTMQIVNLLFVLLRNSCGGFPMSTSRKFPMPRTNLQTRWFLPCLPSFEDRTASSF
jgi:hypothetical protein